MNEILRIEHPLELEAGGYLPGVEIAYRAYGNPASDRIVWICHALTANADPAEWWSGLVGEGKYFDPAEDFIVCANMLGSCYGTTGPLSMDKAKGGPFYSDFPLVTIRDIVRVLQKLKDHLSLPRIDVLIGGSMGGQQALEWAYMEPEAIRSLIVLATNAKHSPWGIAFNEAQRMAITADESFYLEPSPDAGKKGMMAARATALLSYRSYEGYAAKQSEETEDKYDEFRATSYMQYQGEKLADRFNAYSYYALSKAMDSHNLARDRGNLKEVLADITAPTLAIGIASDVLFPLEEQQFIARHVANGNFAKINSAFGHDGFLLEYDQIARAIRKFFVHTPHYA